MWDAAGSGELWLKTGGCVEEEAEEGEEGDEWGEWTGGYG